MEKDKNKKDFSKIILKLISIYILLFFCMSNTSQALMVKLSLRKLTNTAEAIILGEVENIQCEWSMDRSLILSVVTLKIQEILKGDFNNTQILIQHPGGKIGDIGLKVSDMPTFQKGEMVLVFLKSISKVTDTKNSPTISLNILPAFSLFGQAQGKYSIDSNGMARKSGYELISKDKEPDASLSLSELRAKVYDILQKKS